MVGVRLAVVAAASMVDGASFAVATANQSAARRIPMISKSVVVKDPLFRR